MANCDPLGRRLGQQLNPTTNPYRRSMIRNNLLRGTGEVNPRTFARCLAASEDLILHLESRFINSGSFDLVGALTFNKGGNILVSGHAEGRISLWALDHIPPKLVNEIYDVDLGPICQVDFMTYRDDQLIVLNNYGELKKVHIRESGGAMVTTDQFPNPDIYFHNMFATTTEEHVLYTCLDRYISLVDMRESKLHTLKRSPKVILNQLGVHPAHDNLIAVGGEDKFARVFDIRNARSPFHLYCPDFIHKKAEVERLRFSVRGELLVSYFREDLFLFSNDMKDPSPTSQIQDYAIDMTYKESGIGFYGPNSDYVFRGWDSGELYFWRKKDGKFIHKLQSEIIEESTSFFVCHPHLPMLAGFGSRNNIQICTLQSW